MKILEELSEFYTYSIQDNNIRLQPNPNGLEHIDILLDSLSPNETLHVQKDGSIEVKSKEDKKYHTVYTTGCYDLLHYGHLNIFEKSKAVCDYLIVGVSTDELIIKEKGRKPVIPFEERVKMLEAIKYVDLVIPQIDKEKQKIVDSYRIDAISVGDDWRGKYPKVSCDMIYIPYTKAVSSTILKDALKLNPVG